MGVGQSEVVSLGPSQMSELRGEGGAVHARIPTPRPPKGLGITWVCLPHMLMSGSMSGV